MNSLTIETIFDFAIYKNRKITIDKDLRNHNLLDFWNRVRQVCSKKNWYMKDLGFTVELDVTRPFDEETSYHPIDWKNKREEQKLADSWRPFTIGGFYKTLEIPDPRDPNNIPENEPIRAPSLADQRQSGQKVQS